MVLSTDISVLSCMWPKNKELISALELVGMCSVCGLS